MIKVSTLNWSLSILAAWCCLSAASASPALAEWRGSDFLGGGQAHFGSAKYGREHVNYIYAHSTGPAAAMTAVIHLQKAPRQPVFLTIEGMDDDFPSQCRIRLMVNDHELFQGPSGFPDAQWLVRRFPIPEGALHAGSNQVSIVNMEPAGSLGMPPWFMVARCALAGAEYKMPSTALASFQVRLPSRTRPLPEPLGPGHPQPGFKFRGSKGWNWTPEQYLEEIPALAGLKMNFLMNCYTSLFSSSEPGAWKNEWWKPIPNAKKDAYAKVIGACHANGITFCFALHPQFASPRPLDPDSADDFELFYQHYAWAQSQGVKWFCISIDDVGWGKRGAAYGGTQHASFVNKMFRRLREEDAEAQLLFCPVPYSGDGTGAENEAYLGALARDMEPDVYVFWTGDGTVTGRITRRAAESYKSIVKHRLFLWDNYPVNDAQPTLHLGPVSGRDADLGDVIDGYMSNPMATQNEMNRIPLATCADYAYNPWAYDPARSIGQAIRHTGKNRAQRQVLAELVETYPGFIVTGGGTGTNPVRTKFEHLRLEESRATAQKFIQHIEDISTRLSKEFPDQYRASRKTIAADVAWMKQRLDSKL